MRHRHLTDPGLTTAAIDDIIERGSLDDWIELGIAAADGSVRAKIVKVVEVLVRFFPRSGDDTSKQAFLLKHLQPSPDARSQDAPTYGG